MSTLAAILVGFGIGVLLSIIGFRVWLAWQMWRALP